jgi:hypothetical protein
MKVTESIFDNGKVLVPMADVQHIEYVRHPTIGANGIWIITKHTRWDMDADTWANPVYIHEGDKQEFINSYCRFRNELDEIDAAIDATTLIEKQK